MKIKLVHCANINMVDKNDNSQKNIFFMPMGFIALCNELCLNGYDAEIIHSDLLRSCIDREIDFNDIDVIAMDCHWINQSYHVLSFAEYIKSKNKNIFVVLGGYSASLFATEIISNYDFIDAVIRGDGEIPIVELCRELEKENKNLHAVQNLVWKNNGTVEVNDFSYIADDQEISKLNFSNFSLLRDWKDYRFFSKFWTSFSPINQTNLFLLEIGRGCTNACIFCGGNCEAQTLMNNRKKYSVRTIDSVMETVKEIVKYGFETLYTCFEFDNSDEYYCNLFDRIHEYNSSMNYIFGAWKLPTKKLIDNLSSNFKNVILEISPESSSEDLRKFNKDKRIFYTNKQLEETLDYAAQLPNVKVQIYFGYYLINDNKQTILSTIRYILNLLLKYKDVVEIEYTNFSTDPGSLLFLHPDKYNVDIQVRNMQEYNEKIKEKYLKQLDLTADMKIFKPKYISDDEDKEIDRIIKLFNYLFEYFAKSLSYIVNLKNDVDLFVDILDSGNLTLINGVDFDEVQVKEIIIKKCRDKELFDPNIMKLVDEDAAKAKSSYKGVKPVPKIKFI